LRMNLWVIRSDRENPGTVSRPHPSGEMTRKEVPSTAHIGAFPLVST
jgi:4-hydroxybenzoate polyprenyltransferase